LDELEKFILFNKHLPNLPSEKEAIVKGNIDLLELNLMLLEKIEELHLYIIQLKKIVEDK
jgi:hypothetical protein